MPQISVIVPVYKVEPYLHRCVKSILSQTFQDFELILVDDGSPDGCPEICDDYARRDIRVHVIHQENGGLSAARNTGIDWSFTNSDSSWITFVDSDDWLECHYLEWLYNAVKHFHTNISMCELTKTSSENVPVQTDCEVSLLGPEQAYSLNCSYISAYACGRLYHKSTIGVIRFPVGKYYEDIYTTYQLLFQEKQIALVNAPIYYYFQNSQSITGSKWTPHKLDQLDAFKVQIPYLENYGAHSTANIVRHQRLVCMCGQLGLIRKSNNYEFKQYERQLKREIIKCVGQELLHRRLSMPEDAWLCEEAFPLAMKIYWISKNLAKKIGCR